MNAQTNPAKRMVLPLCEGPETHDNDNKEDAVVATETRDTQEKGKGEGLVTMVAVLPIRPGR